MLTSERDGEIVLARVDGEIDLGNAQSIEAGLAQLLGDAGSLVVDLGGVTYFDSAGIRMLDGVVGLCEGSGLPVRIVAPSGGRVRFILRICAWREELLAETVEDATASIG